MWYLGSTPIVERNHGLVFSAFFFTTLALVTISMRIYTRTVMVRNLGLDDILIVVALVGSISYLTSAMEQIRFGLGDAVRLESLQSFLIALYATVVSYSFTQMMVKFSILFQYRRIFQTQLASKITMGIMIWFVAYGLVCLGTSIFTCWPIAKYWDPDLPGGCIDRSVLHYFLAGFNIFNDFLLLFVPIPYLRKLNVNRRVKTVLIGVFACGAFACVVSIVRLNSLYINNSAPINEQPIFGVDIALWSCLEINIAMICASVPSLKALFVKIMPRLLGSSVSGGAGSKHSKGTGGSRFGIGYVNGRSRSAGGSVPLQSFDNNIGGGGSSSSGRDRDLETGVDGDYSFDNDGGVMVTGGLAGNNNNHHDNSNKGGITVHQTFEMRTMDMTTDNMMDDGSEKDLVTKSWISGFNAPDRGGGGVGAVATSRKIVGSTSA